MERERDFEEEDDYGLDDLDKDELDDDIYQPEEEEDDDERPIRRRDAWDYNDEDEPEELDFDREW